MRLCRGSGFAGVHVSSTQQHEVSPTPSRTRPRVRATAAGRNGQKAVWTHPDPVVSAVTLNNVQTFQKPSKGFSNANFPVNAEGRTYHIGTKKGEVANRILSVGSMDRALLVAELLQPPRPGQEVFQHLSARGFLTITGLYKGVPVSIVSTNMGMPNMDFVVRENRAVVEGHMAIVRLGTCGALQPPAHLGSLLVASKGAICVRRDPDAITLGNTSLPYAFSLPVPSCSRLAALLAAEAQAQVGPDHVVQGLNATADSFYSSQGRVDAAFEDHNELLLAELLHRHPDVISLEMETFQLLDLARCSKGTISAAAFCIALAERYSNAFMASHLIEAIEHKCGVVALNTLVKFELQGQGAGAAAGVGVGAARGVLDGSVKYVWQE